MNYEVEQKFRVSDFAPVRERLAALGAKEQPAVVQVDTYYNHPSRDFAETDEALRIRSVGEQNFVTYKGPKVDSVTKTRQEIELSIEPGAKGLSRFGELLVALGFVRVASVRKTRTALTLTWKTWQVEAALDEVDPLGSFVELELTSDEAHLNEARSALAELAKEIHLDQSERRSYLELLLEIQAS